MSKKSALSSLFVLALIIGLVFIASPGQASLVNGGFETGSISGWNLGYILPGGSAGAVEWNPHNTTWGSYFLQLTNAMVYQTFHLDANETIASRVHAQSGSLAIAMIFGGQQQGNMVTSTGEIRIWSFTALTPGDYTLQYSAAGTGAFDTVPLPATVYLLGAGLVGLYGIRRRFSRKQKS